MLLLLPNLQMGGSEVVPVIDTIDGANTVVLTMQYEGITIFTDGTNWWIGV